MYSGIVPTLLWHNFLFYDGWDNKGKFNTTANLLYKDSQINITINSLIPVLQLQSWLYWYWSGYCILCPHLSFALVVNNETLFDSCLISITDLTTLCSQHFSVSSRTHVNIRCQNLSHLDFFHFTSCFIDWKLSELMPVSYTHLKSMLPWLVAS